MNQLINYELAGFGELNFIKSEDNELILHLAKPKKGHEKKITLPDKVMGMKVTVLSLGSLSQLGLEEIELPKYLRVMMKGSLSNNNLKEIHIPEYVEELSPTSLGWNPLNKITVDENNKVFHDIDGKGVYKGETIVLGTKSGIIADGTKFIGKYSFSGVNFDDNTVVLPESVEVVEEMAFANEAVNLGYNISSIEFNEGLKIIKRGAFRWSDLTEIKLPETLEVIEHSAFMMSKIESLVIPDSVKEIHFCAFQKNKIKQLKIGAGLKSIDESVFESNELVEVFIPKNIKFLRESCFSDNQIREFEVEGEGVKFGQNVFSNNKIEVLDLPIELTSVSLYSGPFVKNPIKNVFIREKTELPLRHYLDEAGIKSVFVLDTAGEVLFEEEVEVNINRVRKKEFENARKLLKLIS